MSPVASPYTAFSGRLGLSAFDRRVVPYPAGGETNGALPFAAGLAGEGVRDFGLYRLFHLLAGFGSSLGEFLSVFQPHSIHGTPVS